MLPALRVSGLKPGIVTDAHNGNSLKRLRKAGLEEYFDAILKMDMHGKAKPSPEPFFARHEDAGRDGERDDACRMLPNH